MDEIEPGRRDELRLAIIKHRNELEEAVNDLQSVIDGGLERVDLRRRIIQAPWPWLTGGFVVGLILSMRK